MKTSQRSDAEMNTKIFEVVFSPSESTSLDEAVPFYVDNLNPGWRELQAYAEIYRQEKYKTAEVVGVFSPKFAMKAGISVHEFQKFIQNSPSGDVYFINPYPQIAYRSLNVWMQGELAHPGLIDLTKELLNHLNLDYQLLMEKRQGPNILCYCNFWAGTPSFWEKYVGGVLMPIVNFLEGHSESNLVRKLTSKTKYVDPAPFLPFIVERLFSTFLQSTSDIVGVAWKHGIEDIIGKYCLNNFERIMVEGLVEEIDHLDSKGDSAFLPEVYSRMWLNSKLWQQHNDDYYQFVPHPHSGRCLQRSD